MSCFGFLGGHFAVGAVDDLYMDLLDATTVGDMPLGRAVARRRIRMLDVGQGTTEESTVKALDKSLLSPVPTRAIWKLRSPDPTTIRLNPGASGPTFESPAHLPAEKKAT